MVGLLSMFVFGSGFGNACASFLRVLSRRLRGGSVVSSRRGPCARCVCLINHSTMDGRGTPRPRSQSSTLSHSSMATSDVAALLRGGLTPTSATTTTVPPAPPAVAASSSHHAGQAFGGNTGMYILYKYITKRNGRLRARTQVGGSPHTPTAAAARLAHPPFSLHARAGRYRTVCNTI